MTLPHLPGKLAKIGRKNSSRFQIVGIKYHAKTRFIAGFQSSEIKNGRTDVVLAGKVQVDDAYLGGERTGGKVGRGSENKVAFIAAVSLTKEDRPLRVRLTPVPGFTLKAVAAWAKDHLEPGSAVFSDGLACFGAVTEAGCSHQPTVIAGRKPKDVPEFKWINTVLGNLKTSLSGCYHAFDFRKYAARYLAAFCYRFNRRFDLRSLQQRLLIAAAGTTPQPLRSIRVADVR